MALPPTIPTSFAPRAASSVRHFSTNFTSAFGFFAYGVLTLAFVLALGVFFYGRILTSTAAAKDAALATAQAALDPTTVENFVRLRDRLSSSRNLLEDHIALSNFFSSFGDLLPVNVRFASLHLSQNDAGVVKVDGSGAAKNFNALAATSNAIAMDGRIKDAIFSNISINTNGSVSFAFSATIDPKFVTFAPTAAVPLAAAADTLTASSTTPFP